MIGDTYLRVKIHGDDRYEFLGPFDHYLFAVAELRKRPRPAEAEILTVTAHATVQSDGQMVRSEEA